VLETLVDPPTDEYEAGTHTIVGALPANGEIRFETAASAVRCLTAAVSGTVGGLIHHKDVTIKSRTTYTNCRVEELGEPAATVTTNHCEEWFEEAGDTGLNPEMPDAMHEAKFGFVATGRLLTCEIKIMRTGCEIKIMDGGNTSLPKATLENISNASIIKAEMMVTGITYKGTGASCEPSEVNTHHDGVYKGTLEIKGNSSFARVN